MVDENDKTYEATLKLLLRSENNEREIETLLSSNRKMTSRELADKLGWTLNKTNSTLYRLKNKHIIEFNYLQNKGKLVKQVEIVPRNAYLKK
jgi:transcription initiation factor IIE alpha subunit